MDAEYLELIEKSKKLTQISKQQEDDIEADHVLMKNLVDELTIEKNLSANYES